MMAVRTISVLHVEDETISQQCISYFLGSMCDFECRIHIAEGEGAALHHFQRSSVDLVILDYHLRDGNGMNCLRRVRELDEIVPIIVVSREATFEVAKELLQGGADTCLTKNELHGELLAANVRNALERASVWGRSRSGSANDCP